MRDQFKNGNAAVHTLPDLDLGMKGELKRDTASFDEDGEVHIPENFVHFSRTVDDLAIFDCLQDT